MSVPDPLTPFPWPTGGKATPARCLSILQYPQLFDERTQNVYIFPAMMFGLIIVFLFCYIP
ncbi:hypothetical protein HOY82DRAFT_559115 [Tuber indicum]|nr:hypothetical protein HOY82DRAFT_559115 [Tuber indicum]